MRIKSNAKCHMKTKMFTASLDHLHGMLKFISEKAQALGFKDHLRKIELAAEEAIVNVIHHSYSGREGKIQLDIDFNHDALHVTISDFGKPFNPLAQETSFSPNVPIEERDVGGLGLVFIRKCADDVSYERKGEQNVLSLTFFHRQ